VSGKGTAPKSGDELKQRVVALVQSLGLKAQVEVKAARRLWGQRRYIDVMWSSPMKKAENGWESNASFRRRQAQQKKRFLQPFKIWSTGLFQGSW
jgi:hypothetical protein